MRATKDSGVDWLGEVPAKWETSPLRTLMKLRNERNTFYRSDNYLSLMANVGIIPYAEKGDVGNKAPEDLGKCKIVSEGDFVLNSMNFGIGSFGVSAYNGVCSSVYVVMEPRLEKAFPSFLRYIFSMQPFQKHVQSLGNGILEHRAAIGWDELKNIGFPMPDLDEQRRIADFLDLETAKIDALIAKQEQLITTLDERRGAVISRAVTSGLVKDRPLRDSGVEWLGQIPIDWKTGRIRNVLAGPIVDGPHETPVFGDEGFPFLSVDAIQDGELVLEGCRLIDEHSFNGYRRKASPRFGDILMGKAASTGKIAMVKVETEFAIWSPLALIRVNNRKFEPRFVEYSLKSSHSQAEIDTLCTSNTQKNISMGDIPKISISIPPLTEQKEISDFLDQETDQISQSKNQASRMKELLLERRQALISAAVTGKLEVTDGYS